MSPTYKLVRDNGHYSGDEIMFESDDLLDVAQFARDKGGGADLPPLDVGIEFDDGEGLL